MKLRGQLVLLHNKIVNFLTPKLTLSPSIQDYLQLIKYLLNSRGNFMSVNCFSAWFDITLITN